MQPMNVFFHVYIFKIFSFKIYCSTCDGDKITFGALLWEHSLHDDKGLFNQFLGELYM